jgi:ABC-type branched-subunit amino acid transport system ATPase component
VLRGNVSNSRSGGEAQSAHHRALLSVAGVSKAYRGLQAVAGVSFDIAPGEVVVLLGPNGAGKTTLLNLLTGQQRPDSGRVVFDGVDITRASAAAQSRRSMLRGYQDGGMFPKLTAVENAVVPLLARGMPRSEAERRGREALGRLGLAPVMDERVERLSGGQRKLTDFARCLVSDARLILLDEPTTGVHPHVATSMAQEIHRRTEAGATFLIVSHDLPWAFSVCSRVIFMAAGEILVDGDPQTVRDDPRVHEAYL